MNIFSILLFVLLGLTSVHAQPEPIEVCDGKVDLLYIMDISGSIRDEDWPIVEGFFINLTAAFNVTPDAARVGVVTFSRESRVRLLFSECDDSACVDALIASISHDTANGTNIFAALQDANDVIYADGNGERPDVIDVVVLFTDGKSNRNEELTIPEADILKAGGAEIFVVAIGNDTQVNVTELTLLASEPVETNLLRIVNRDDFSELLDQVAPLAEGTCNVINPPTEAPATTVLPMTTSSKPKCRCPKVKSK